MEQEVRVELNTMQLTRHRVSDKHYKWSLKVIENPCCFPHLMAANTIVEIYQKQNN